MSSWARYLLPSSDAGSAEVETMRRHLFLKVVGFGLFALALGTFALQVTTKVFSGHAGDTYQNVYRLTNTYWGAFLTLICIAVVGLIGLAYYLWRVLKERRAKREVSNEGSSHPGADATDV